MKYLIPGSRDPGIEQPVNPGSRDWRILSGIANPTCELGGNSGNSLDEESGNGTIISTFTLLASELLAQLLPLSAFLKGPISFREPPLPLPLRVGSSIGGGGDSDDSLSRNIENSNLDKL